MSRIGKSPVGLPKQVQASIDPPMVTVKGPKGTLTAKVAPEMQIEITDEEIRVARPNDARRNRALHGVTRSIIQNMVTGVSEGFKKDLEIQGVGYRANVQGGVLTMNLGYSHPVDYPVPSDVAVDIKDQRIITVQGIDKQRVGQVAAEIRAFRKPEPYKGTGIRYVGEHIVRKEGKSGAK